MCRILWKCCDRIILDSMQSWLGGLSTFHVIGFGQLASCVKGSGADRAQSLFSSCRSLWLLSGTGISFARITLSVLVCPDVTFFSALVFLISTDSSWSEPFSWVLRAKSSMCHCALCYTMFKCFIHFWIMDLFRHHHCLLCFLHLLTRVFMPAHMLFMQSCF